MSRVVSLYLPTWPTDRLRRNSGVSPEGAGTFGGAVELPPLVLVGRDGRKRVVVAADVTARSLGIQPGMAASMAQALVAGLAVHDADPTADAQALDRLALWLLRRYAPVVATDPPDGLMIDVSGATHLHGGEAATLFDMVDRLAAVGIAARVAVAGTYGAAHALARFHGPPVTVINEGDHEALVVLPVAALRLPTATVDGLRRLGFDRVGELAATPRAPLALRFGSDVSRRLDQMFGRSSEPFDLIEAPELIRVRQAFAEPIAAAETIARYIAKLSMGSAPHLRNAVWVPVNSTCCSTASTTHFSDTPAASESRGRAALESEGFIAFVERHRPLFGEILKCRTDSRSFKAVPSDYSDMISNIASTLPRFSTIAPYRPL
jgi:protein ImuB